MNDLSPCLPSAFDWGCQKGVEYAESGLAELAAERKKTDDIIELKLATKILNDSDLWERIPKIAGVPIKDMQFWLSIAHANYRYTPKSRPSDM